MPNSPDSEIVLPPLIALRVLEASARLRSFSKAARELNVTPSAVTQHIRTIEAWAGTPLFRRTGREVLVSELAETVLPRLREGFALLNEAAHDLKTIDRRQSVVRVAVSPSIASKWLLPRLEAFRAAHPDLDVWVVSSWDLIDFHKTEVDIAIRYGPGEYGGLLAEKLLEERILPVASPDLIARIGPLRAPRDLLRTRLLHDANTRRDSSPTWPMWFKTRGIDEPAIYEGPRYNQTSLIVEEAVAGKGIALARRVIAQGDLNAGRLVPLLDDPGSPTSYAYWLVWPRGRSLSPPTRAFIAWIRDHCEDGITGGLGI